MRLILHTNEPGILAYMGYAQVVLNNWGVVVSPIPNRPPEERQAIIEAIESVTYHAPVDVIRAVQEYCLRDGIMPESMAPMSITPDGNCNPQAKERKLCKPLKTSTDVCAGCGKSYIAGSYVQPSRCVPQKPSEWQLRMAPTIQKVIADNGGVSNVAPLTTTPGGGVQRILPTKRR